MSRGFGASGSLGGGAGGLIREELLGRLEEAAESFHRSSRTILPHVARFCLVSTFLEDGMRMWFQWSEQRDYMNNTWKVGIALASLFVVVNLTGQLGASIAILARQHVKIAVGVLFAIVGLQTVAYSILWDVAFLIRNFALVGALLLLVAEVCVESRSLSRPIFAGVPSLGDANATATNYLQLVGRILVSLMFLTLLKGDFYASLFSLLQNVIAAALMVAVFVGFRTKLSALLLVFWLLVLNFCLNNFWSVPSHSMMRDFLKYDFFQTLSVVGGLLMLVSYGPGGVSLDEKHKKAW